MSTCLQLQYNRIGFNVNENNDDHLTRIGRPLILALACALRLQDCVTKAARVYTENLDDLTKYNNS